MLCKQQQGSGEHPHESSPWQLVQQPSAGTRAPAAHHPITLLHLAGETERATSRNDGLNTRARFNVLTTCTRLRPVRTLRSQERLPSASAAPQPASLRRHNLPARGRDSSRLSHTEGLVIHERQESSNVQLKAERDICERSEKQPNPTPPHSFNLPQTEGDGHCAIILPGALGSSSVKGHSSRNAHGERSSSLAGPSR